MNYGKYRNIKIAANALNEKKAKELAAVKIEQANRNCGVFFNVHRNKLYTCKGACR